MVETAKPGPQQLRCVVVTPERAVVDAPADFVAVPLYDGELGVLPGRAPLVGRLGVGELRFRKGDRVERFYIDGGFVQVRSDVVSVLTSKALPVDEIDAAAARRALDAALAPATGEKQEAQFKAQTRARAQLRMARTRNELASH
jgi:F-type H+-transporting ATPase subunit epsilon